jgi:cytidyltransferase-like protein
LPAANVNKAFAPHHTPIICRKDVTRRMPSKLAIYPGSFDPVTNGHLDILARGLSMFDRIIVAILYNPKKESLFSMEERKSLLHDCLEDYANVEVDTFAGLLVDYARRSARAPFCAECAPCRISSMSSRWH